MKQSTVSMRIRIENLCIGIIFLFSLMLFARSFFHRSSAEAAVLVSTEMGWMVQRAVSVLLFCLVSQLKKRKRAAYDITLLLLLLSLLRGVRQLTPASVLISVIDLLLLAAFLCFRRDFCCPAAPKGRKRSLYVLLLSVLGVLANAAVSYHYLSPVLGRGRHTFFNSIQDSLLILLGNQSAASIPHAAHVLELSMFWFSWLCIVAALVYAFKPWLAPAAHHASDI